MEIMLMEWMNGQDLTKIHFNL